MIDVRTREASRGEATCPLCRERLGAEGTSCRGCDTRYHDACLAELGGCSTLGCAARGVAGARPSVPACAECGELAPARLTRWPCPCGVVVHDGCLDRHALLCEPARRLRPVVAAPEPLEWRTSAGQAVGSAALGQLLQVMMLALLVVGGQLEGLWFALPILILFWQAYEATTERGGEAGADRATTVAAASLLVPGAGLLVWGALFGWFTVRARAARERARVGHQ